MFTFIPTVSPPFLQVFLKVLTIWFLSHSISLSLIFIFIYSSALQSNQLTTLPSGVFSNFINLGYLSTLSCLHFHSHFVFSFSPQQQTLLSSIWCLFWSFQTCFSSNSLHFINSSLHPSSHSLHSNNLVSLQSGLFNDLHSLTSLFYLPSLSFSSTPSIISSTHPCTKTPLSLLMMVCLVVSLP